MVFSSLTFLFLFLPILYICYFIRKNDTWRNLILVLASVIFYAWGEPVWILAMFFSIAVNYITALLITKCTERHQRIFLLTLGIIASLAFLFYFKYAAFFINSFAALLKFSFRMKTPALPIGISFYTFQILTYTVDVYRGKTPALRNPIHLILYISCFPQLIAGPIVQYSDVAASLPHRDISVDDFNAGFQRFCIGLFKKVFFANLCGSALEALPQAGTGTVMSVAGAWFAAFLYTMQIYYDFSAYSDMAIGLGQTLGFRYKENFDHPYASGSVSEFWRRWHISLGAFFRDYVYIPLGGNRKGTARTIFNLLVVWALTGLWHGASWNFVLWGCYYGILQITERFVLAPVLEKLPHLFRQILTFLLVVIGWVLFYYTDLAAVGQHLAAMFGIGSGTGAVPLIDADTLTVLRKYLWIALLAFLVSLPLSSAFGKAFRKPALSKGNSDSVAAVRPMQVSRALFCAVLLFLCVIFLVGQSYNPFIYFRF